MELTVVVDSVVRMREQQLWPFPDPRDFAIAAENAGVDGILLSLHIDHVAVRDRDWRDFESLDRATLCIALSPRSASLEDVAASSARRCVLVPAMRHEHSSGGSLDVAVTRSLIENARSRFAGTGVELAARIDPSLDALRICIDAGLDAVEFNSAGFALAGGDRSRSLRIETLRECVARARSQGLRVSVRGGLSFDNAAALTHIDGIQEVRVGQALVAQALFDGIDASVARMRNLLGD